MLHVFGAEIGAAMGRVWGSVFVANMHVRRRKQMPILKVVGWETEGTSAHVAVGAVGAARGHRKR
jgi:hypothetical protein